TTDNATVTGGDAPSGAITFTLTPPSGPAVSVATNGDGHSAGPVTMTQVGTYKRHGSRADDGHDDGTAVNGTNETVVTINASPSTSTHHTLSLHDALPTSTTDNATVTGGDAPSGAITFTLTPPSGPAVSVATNGDGHSAGPVTMTQVGT